MNATINLSKLDNTVTGLLMREHCDRCLFSFHNRFANLDHNAICSAGNPAQWCVCQSKSKKKKLCVWKSGSFLLFDLCVVLLLCGCLCKFCFAGGGWKISGGGCCGVGRRYWGRREEKIFLGLFNTHSTTADIFIAVAPRASSSTFPSKSRHDGRETSNWDLSRRRRRWNNSRLLCVKVKEHNKVSEEECW